MQMTYANTESLIPVAAYAVASLSRSQQPHAGLRCDENTAPAGRRYR
jgi:hypothetical protein